MYLQYNSEITAYVIFNFDLIFTWKWSFRKEAEFPGQKMVKPVRFVISKAKLHSYNCTITAYGSLNFDPTFTWKCFFEKKKVEFPGISRKKDGQTSQVCYYM